MIPNIKRIEYRFQCVVAENLLKQLYFQLEQTIDNHNKTSVDYLSKEEEAELVLSFCRIKDCMFDPIPFSKYLDEGAEQKVFIDSEKKRVTKLNDAIFYVNWSQYFESIIIHNILFPQTAYELIGFVLINDRLYAVVSQQYINATEETNLESIKSLMKEKGFSVKRRNDYINDELGLIIEDLHEENVLTQNGVPFFIDTVIYLK